MPLIIMTQNIHWQYEARLESDKKETEIKIWLAQPIDSFYQKINSFKINIKPDFIYQDQQGNKILYCKIKKSLKTTIKIDIHATLSKDDKDAACLLPAVKKIRLEKKWLKSEKFLEQTKTLKEITLKLTAKDKDDWGKVRTIFDFVANSFHYQYPVKNRGVKNLDLTNLGGDCAEYSGLLVTMCRILNIPAKNQTGFVIDGKNKSAAEHGWASIYLKKYGWRDIAPQYASLEKNPTLGKKYFLRRCDYRLNFVDGFNLPLKPNIPAGFNKKFWLEQGLPLTNTQVQTLQPLIFVSDKPVKFTEKIKLNRGFSFYNKKFRL